MSEDGARVGRNIVIFSDGTGQRGGVFFDEARTNIYKLYRAARCGPDSCIDPNQQLAFYDPGLGTQAAGGGFIKRTWRTLYNIVSQATGLGITRNVIDCYAAIIQLWRPGDRIFLFGFSRGAYTVRCLATALCYSGIPTQDGLGQPLKRDIGTARKLATRAVKTVYQHVSSPRDQQFFAQRQALAQQYRLQHACADDQNAFPFFIGVFDTVAALADRTSLFTLGGAYIVLIAAVSGGLAYVTDSGALYWSSWLLFDTFCVAFAAYVYTHLKFAMRLPGFRWWQTIHLTTFRQKFYDQDLDKRIKYARHAISIDERRADFKRVRWGSSYYAFPGEKISHLEQLWFAGNHADIGGGYAENEARLSDNSLNWMIEAASDSLKEEGLLLDRSVLRPHGAADGMQHDETRSLVFRLAGKSDRDPVPDATLHPTVVDRFYLPGVVQYDVVAPYRPEALRGHDKFPGAYDDIPLPRQTCTQQIKASLKTWRRARPIGRPLRDRIFTKLKEFWMDRIVSCCALFALAIMTAIGVLIFGHQCLTWLQIAVWPPMPLSKIVDVPSFVSAWSGLDRLYSWFLALPLSLTFIIVGFLVFWLGGICSAYLYRRAASVASKAVTPAQTRA